MWDRLKTRWQMRQMIKRHIKKCSSVICHKVAKDFTLKYVFNIKINDDNIWN